MSRYSNNHTGLFVTLAVIAVLIIAFFITSLSMASAHSNTLVDEWQSWFGIIEEQEDADTETDTETGTDEVDVTTEAYQVYASAIEEIA